MTLKTYKIALRFLTSMACAAALMFSCSPDAPKKPAAAAENPNANATSFDDLKIQPKVSVTEIDSLEFALIGLNVGLADKVFGQVPSINYLMPQKADFVQIIRCRADAQLGELFEIDQNNTNSKIAWQKFIMKDYWDLARLNSQCVYVSAGFSGTTYLDVFAPNDSLRYLARACATRERILDIGELPVGDCGRWVSVTNTLTNFVNKNTEIENDKQKKSREMRDKADTLIRRAYYITVDMNREFLRCDKNWEKGSKNKAKRDAMFNFLQKGTGVAMQAFSYNPPVDVGGIISGISDIMASPNDFQRACVQGEKYRRDGELIAAELQSLEKQFPEIVKAAGDGQ
jgi:hypothetical protein